MINKYVFKISTVFILLLIVVLIISGCSMGADSKYESSSRTSPKETESSVQENIPQNETMVLLSPDGKYRAEAYGTLTDITAGGFFPYEGVRVIDVKSEEVLWNKEPGGYTVKFL
jgi:guanyl-specific ribonuclease Sa